MKVINIDDLRHGIRVANLSLSILTKANIKSYKMQSLYISALFHDIGKAHLNQDILNKPGKLTEEERKHIEEHPKFSYKEILKIGYSDEIAKAILHHHENFDGSGYPEGLKGEQIPLGSRIIKIADVYDALTNNRVYRKEFSIIKTMKIMKAESKNYDIYLFNIFKEIVNGRYKGGPNGRYENKTNRYF